MVIYCIYIFTHTHISHDTIFEIEKNMDFPALAEPVPGLPAMGSTTGEEWGANKNEAYLQVEMN